MRERTDLRGKLVGLIQEGKLSEALNICRGVKDRHEAGECVFAVFEGEAPQELIEAALQAFLNSRENYRPEHGYWVHSLSHFTRILWEHRLVDWIKEFNKVAFQGANELGDSNCSDRLVDDFAEYANWDDNPADFHLTPANLQWLDWEYMDYARDQIELAPFASEEAFLRCQLGQPRRYTSWDFETQADLVDAEKVKAIIQKLLDLGVPASELKDVERGLFAKQLKELEAELSAATQDWQRERAEKGIQKTQAALVQLAPHKP